MRIIILTFLLILSLSLFTDAYGDEPIAFRLEEGKYLDVLRAGNPLLRYMFEFDDSTPEELHRTYKVYHHVFDPTGNS